MEQRRGARIGPLIHLEPSEYCMTTDGQATNPFNSVSSEPVKGLDEEKEAEHDCKNQVELVAEDCER